ncbi:MAG: PH domain-containing protein, partial [Clostridiaceae bacterium]
MGLMSGLMGNASEVDVKEVQDEYGKILAPSENVEKAYK